MTRTKIVMALLGCAACAGSLITNDACAASPDIVKEYAAIVQEICACSSAACTKTSLAKFERFRQRVESPSSPKPTEAQLKELSRLNGERSTCQQRSFVASAPPQTKKPSQAQVLTSARTCTVTADGGDLFYLDDYARVKRVALAGGRPEELAEAPRVHRFAVAGKDVYYVVGTQIRRIARNGGASVLVLDRTGLHGSVSDTDLTALGADAKYVYWSDGTGVHRVSRTGGKPSTLGKALSIEGFVLDERHVYYYTPSELFKVPKAGGTPVKVLDSSAESKSGSPNGARWLWRAGSLVAPKGNYLYGRSTGCGILRIPKQGGTPSVLVDADPRCDKGLYISVGETIVYESGGAAGQHLLETDLKGGNPSTIRTTTGDICAIAHSGKSILVASDRELWRFAR